MKHAHRRRTRLVVAWAMVLIGLLATPIGIWVTEEPVVLVVMSGSALVFEAVIALLVVTQDSDDER